MARMMPPYCQQTAPPGEKFLYNALKNDPTTGDWIVLHSLNIAEHIKQIEGEADFVILVPHKGILVIEVKSHLSASRTENGLWKLGNQATSRRSPFQQASEAMYSIRDFLIKNGINLREIPFLNCVWFTGIRNDYSLQTNLEWHDWQALWSEELRNVSQSIMQVFDKGTYQIRSKNPKFALNWIKFDQHTAGEIASKLRPKFEMAISAEDRRHARKNQLLTLIEEQYEALDSASENPRVLFTGPAGSGKTILALESAQRELSLGKTGRLLCFNRMIGQQLSKEAPQSKDLIVGTFHKELLRLSGINQTPTYSTPEFWNEELPSLARKILQNGDPSHRSDFLIIDEVQDLTNNQYLDLLDLMVTGGLKGGRVLFFGDFENQSIYARANGREVLQQRIPDLSTYRLTRNCRNLPRIGYQVNLLSHLEPGYKHFRRQDDGIVPKIETYTKSEEQSRLLVSSIQKLMSEGYLLNEIAVLSPHSQGSIATSSSNPWLRRILCNSTDFPARHNQLFHTTIHAFKGLEAPAVIVTDLDKHLVQDNFYSLLYIGLTRATDRLISLFEEDTFNTILGGPQ